MSTDLHVTSKSFCLSYGLVYRRDWFRKRFKSMVSVMEFVVESVLDTRAVFIQSSPSPLVSLLDQSCKAASQTTSPRDFRIFCPFIPDQSVDRFNRFNDQHASPLPLLHVAHIPKPCHRFHRHHWSDTVQRLLERLLAIELVPVVFVFSLVSFRVLG